MMTYYIIVYTIVCNKTVLRIEESFSSFQSPCWEIKWSVEERNKGRDERGTWAMEKSNERVGYHTMKGMSGDPPLCECACAHPRCSLSGLQSSRDHERSQSSFRIRMATDAHTHRVTHRVMRSSQPLPLQSTRKWINLAIKASANSTLLS